MDDSQCFHVTVKGLVLDEHGAVMLLREQSGTFDLPGGRLEHGESFAECLERECREEMGVGCRVLDRLPRFAWTAVDKNGIWRLVLCFAIELEHLSLRARKNASATSSSASGSSRGGRSRRRSSGSETGFDETRAPAASKNARAPRRPGGRDRLARPARERWRPVGRAW
jgi:ADP-ribose pyrophosphatase YjhB (NUDIX family)